MMRSAYANSLSMLSPKPGVSTIVRAMRTPSSSSSEFVEMLQKSREREGEKNTRASLALTNVDGLNSNAVFNVSSVWVVRDFMGQNLGFAQSVHESRAAGARSACSSFETLRK